jgi:hypothetical protein
MAHLVKVLQQQALQRLVFDIDFVEDPKETFSSQFFPLVNLSVNL